MKIIIDQTIDLLSNYNIIQKNNIIYNDLLNLLTENKMSKEFDWSREVWDQLYYCYHEKYKKILIANYNERKNSYRPLAPVMNDFPYKQLKEIYEKEKNKIDKLI